MGMQIAFGQGHRKIAILQTGGLVVGRLRSDIIVKPVITYTLTKWRGYNPRQRWYGVCSLMNCKLIFGFHYND